MRRVKYIRREKKSVCGVDKPEPKQWVTGLYKAVTKRS